MKHATNGMVDPTLPQHLAFYATHGGALFPIPFGQKNPIGIVKSFLHDCSTDPAQWVAWSAANPRCNFGVVACRSGWIIVDIDITKVGRDGAWAAWRELCQSWGCQDAVAPHVQSARGGWHVYFRVQTGVDVMNLQQPDIVKGVIQTRVPGFTVAAGSYYDGAAKGEASGPYALFANAIGPYEAPAALITHCMTSLPPPPPGGKAANSNEKGKRQGPRGATFPSTTEAAAAHYVRMLDMIPGEDYGEWCDVGMALQWMGRTWGDDLMFGWWLAWSKA